MPLYPVVLNSTNLVSTSFNNTYRYSFPVGSVQFKEGSKIAVASVALYYSWQNISASAGNNSFSFVFPGSGTFVVTLPDGFYDIASINTYLQNYCILNNLYLVDSSGNYVYYLELLTNSTYYACQFVAYPVPTSLPSGWTNPGGMVFPGSSVTPQLIVAANSFRSIIGFSAGTYPSVTQSTIYSVLSTSVPSVTPVNSVVMSCNLLQNKYSIPNTILYSFSIDVTYGSLLISNPNQYSFVDIYSGVYSSLDIQFLDQNLNQLAIKDTSILVQLLIQAD